MPAQHSTTVPHPAIVVALGPSAAPHNTLSQELRALLEGLGYQVHAELRQRRVEPSGGLPLGSGKLSELRDLVNSVKETTDAPVLVALAGPLSSGHGRNLEEALGTPVIDRTEVILRIFEARAQSPLAKLEIERARLLHSIPRIRGLAASERQQGGGGRAAKGHSNTELAKRAALRRIAELERRMTILRSEQARRIERRSEVRRVALVGYTNVGKSSWMETLTGRSVGVKDELFHTLGTRVHALRGEGQRVLVADTVGFLQELPHELLESFRSTLDEALEADLVVHVVDASSPLRQAQMEVTWNVLSQSEHNGLPELLLFNKTDLVPADELQELKGSYPNALFVSARSEHDRRLVTDAIRARVVEPLGAPSSPDLASFTDRSVAHAPTSSLPGEPSRVPE